MTHHTTCRIQWSDGHQADPDDCQDCLDAEHGVCAGCLDDERETLCRSCNSRKGNR